MVLGLKANNRRSSSVQLDYRIHLLEIKPWPPSQSLRSLRSALIQWEHSDKNSGSTNPVVPSLGSGSNVGDGKIEFNQSFRLPLTLVRDMSIKGTDSFQKNCLELNLYEPRRDKTVKGLLLATAIIDLAEYGIVKEDLTISTPMKCKRVLSNTAPPVLTVKIHRVEKNRASSLSRDIQIGDGTLDRNGSGSVSALMNEEYAEEAEFASLTDDDVSSHSSTALASSATESQGGSLPQEEENGSEESKEITRDAKVQHDIGSLQNLERKDIKPVMESQGSLKESLCSSSSTFLSSDSGSPENLHSTLSNFSEASLTLIEKSISPCSAQSSSSSIAYEETDKELIISSRRNDQDNLTKDIYVGPREAVGADILENGSGKDKKSNNHQQSTQDSRILDENLHRKEDDTIKEIISERDTLSLSWKNVGVNNDTSKHVKSVRSPMDIRRSNGIVKCSQFFVSKEQNAGVSKDAHNAFRGSIHSGKEDAKVYPKDNKVQKLERRIHMLEGELREAAAIEVSLYSVVAEHGSSVNKVHAPARRLSRFYFHACKENSHLHSASAARSAISGLVLVAKACGNDVPRLTFWLSNCVVLRAIVSQACYHQNFLSVATGSQKGINEKSSLLEWKESSLNLRKETGSALCQNFDDRENLHTFISALENVETWIFSRIVESIWWQTLTPHMQSAAANKIATVMDSISNKLCKTTSSLGEQEKGSFSVELWKKAFNDVYERICPIRAGGHECGCLPELSRLIVEQCVARLDVAMFNAIIRESADEIPTDPVSDPITEPKVLPIPSGKASFGAGAQLKTAIGNWSRWLSDQFGIDDDNLTFEENEAEYDYDNKRKECNTSFKPFYLLHTLSDLMMLPKDMLLCKSIRKEVCPGFTATQIKQILDNFVPDEFCPDPIPDVVFEALESEDPSSSGEDSVIHFPYAADPIAYLPPPATSVSYILGECRNQSQLTRNGSLVLRKSYTSDDELDELDSPSIIDAFRHSPASTKTSSTSLEDGIKNTARYQLLREVWMRSV